MEEEMSRPGDDSLLPRVAVPPPGPKARAIIARDALVTSPSYTRPYPLVIERGEGACVIDPDGNRFLDFAAGIAVCSTGHSHPDVVAAITDQSSRFLHMSATDFYYEKAVALAERIAQLSAVGSGPGDTRVLFTNSGTEAVEAALKLARYRTGDRKSVV